MNEITQEKKQASALKTLADRFGITAKAAYSTLKNTLMPKATDDEMCAFCIVCNEYKLNPFTKEIYAFPSKTGGIVPIVGIDGWLRIINSHPQFDGMNVKLADDGTCATCWIYRKGVTHPTVITEYLDECKRTTEPWKNWPRRMLRHKAIIQCARVAFGFSGIYDEDEGREVAGMRNVTPQAEATAAKPANPFEVVEAEIIDGPNEETAAFGDFIPGLDVSENPAVVENIEDY